MTCYKKETTISPGYTNSAASQYNSHPLKHDVSKRMQTMIILKVWCSVASVMSDSLWPYGL